MRNRDQKKYLDTLKRYTRKMDPKELTDYKMMVKRHKDDEDFDNLTFERLKNLHEKYHVNRERKDYDHLFKKPDENSSD
ncbi:MAG: hypothetical protein K9J16_00880 [Melioribacteraceae bacterium]|nr:hypothetical protein [Melioribacteraceae bacterium]MCF8354039.1 hypothetical protein [Melioribacteraceae bacterium]MCF8392280.1 hypothetical protein [Melioribacteraceae bacterium]MCF8417612.1 hypothetical protein [Melioribacteraceae bacterium]